MLTTPDIARYAEPLKHDSLFGLFRPSHVWSEVFYILGISHRITTVIDAGRPVAVNGQTLRAFNNQELEKLLSGNLILDAESAEILLERGFGRFAGINSGHWQTLNESGFSYEEVRFTQENRIYRMSAQRCSQKFWEMDAVEKAEALTTIYKFDRTALAPGMLRFKNELGGTVVTLAYPLGESQFFVGFFNNLRRSLFQELVISFDVPVAMGDKWPMHVYRCRHSKGVVAAFINSTHDKWENVEFYMNGVSMKNAKILRADGSWETASLKSVGFRHIASHSVDPLEALILNIE